MVCVFTSSFLLHFRSPPFCASNLNCVRPIHVKYIDPDLKQIPVQRGKSEFVETRKTHMKLSGSEASSMEITSREMDENEEDPFGITNY